jgi:hypothetical protein
MNEGTYGIIGVVVGTLLGTLSTMLLDRYNRSKQLYIEANRAGFHYPTGEYPEETLTGRLSIYIYNDSSLPKTFLLEKLTLENSNIIFSVISKINNELASGTVHQIAPNNGLKLIYDLHVHPDLDIKIPNIDDINAVLKYRSGKKSFHLLIPLYYYDPS